MNTIPHIITLGGEINMHRDYKQQKKMPRRHSIVPKILDELQITHTHHLIALTDAREIDEFKFQSCISHIQEITVHHILIVAGRYLLADMRDSIDHSSTRSIILRDCLATDTREQQMTGLQSAIDALLLGKSGISIGEKIYTTSQSFREALYKRASSPK